MKQASLRSSNYLSKHCTWANKLQGIEINYFGLLYKGNLQDLSLRPLLLTTDNYGCNKVRLSNINATLLPLNQSLPNINYDCIGNT